jgi:hypothetical protein
MSAKDMILKPIKSKEANELVKRVHYSGKVVQNSSLHIGVYYQGKLEGCLSFGPSLDKRKILPLVKGTLWNGMLELNRMAFTDALPRNSESRAMAIAFKLIKKHAPHVKWVISFADATQCGDGTIYRAAGFVLTAINDSKNLAKLPNGETIHKMTLESNPTQKRKELENKSYYEITGGKYDFKKYVEVTKAKILKGYQFRYIKFLDQNLRNCLTVEPIPFSEIPNDARMYLGEKLTI